MDLSFVQEQLDTFATFAGAIDDFLQKPAEILGSVVDWFNGEEVHPWETTKEGPVNSDINADWDTTKGAFGSSDSADADAEPSTSSDFSLSSSSGDSE